MCHAQIGVDDSGSRSRNLARVTFIGNEVRVPDLSISHASTHHEYGSLHRRHIARGITSNRHEIGFVPDGNHTNLLA